MELRDSARVEPCLCEYIYGGAAGLLRYEPDLGPRHPPGLGPPGRATVGPTSAPPRRWTLGPVDRRRRYISMDIEAPRPWSPLAAPGCGRSHEPPLA